VPKPRLDGFGVIAPWVTPVPERGILKFGFPPLEVTLIFPVTAPIADGENSAVNDVLCPAASVSGRVSPLKLNPAPLALAAEIVRLDAPEFVSVPESDFEVPVCMFPKLKLAGFDPNWPCATPVPESETASDELLALELIVSVPEAAPAALGLNTVLKVVACPALSVSGRAGPVTVNPLPVAAAPDTVTLVPPVLVTVTGTV
jgi:hypothetical protein